MAQAQVIDLSQIVWRAPEWINALGGLRTDNLLEYFAQSPFFDRRSNNAVLKQQSQFQQFGETTEALRKMRGVEFAVLEARPPDLWIVAKQIRESETETQTINLFFVANGNIYQAPDVDSILCSRLLNISTALTGALGALGSHVQFTPSRGYRYGSIETEKKEEVKKESVGQVDNLESKAMHKALFNAIQPVQPGAST